MRDTLNEPEGTFLNQVPLDMLELNPSQWRQLVAGDLRPMAQRKLITLATPPCPFGVSGQLTLLRMAHAILPLHGEPLFSLGFLMTDDTTNIAVPDFERAEILARVLQEYATDGPPKTTQVIVPILNRFVAALGSLHTQSETKAVTRLRLRILLRNVLASGYEPLFFKEVATLLCVPL